MKIVCAYCRAPMGEKEPHGDDLVSHGMCDACAVHFNRQLDGLSLGEYLDEFPYPVIAVDGDGRVLAANQAMASRLGQEQRALVGLLGGNVMECVHSRLPGGCGKTVHCETCTVRGAVTHTLETGEPLHRVAAYVERSDGRWNTWISTCRVGETIQLVIDPYER